MVIQEARFSLINDVAIMRSGYTMTDCPMQREQRKGTLFGNCAEVYSFIHLLHKKIPLLFMELCFNIEAFVLQDTKITVFGKM
ncbi:hypothetical protein BJX63DRAFT_382142 [Aspergillus granulosus]|uniref:Uncharacterized protein n=1 Tax=Aspergillus granulosus TaxID=176169 RepID=A0ABR4HVE9_9EURO